MNEFKDAISGRPEAVAKKQQLAFHVYYISEIIGHRYIADKKVILGKFYKLIETTETYWIFQTAIDDFPYNWKGYKTKEIALEVLSKL